MTNPTKNSRQPIRNPKIANKIFTAIKKTKPSQSKVKITPGNLIGAAIKNIIMLVTIPDGKKNMDTKENPT